ncbi:MAG: hypothetical protein U0263_24515 [Polyangiaceae bacterium]
MTQQLAALELDKSAADDEAAEAQISGSPISRLRADMTPRWRSMKAKEAAEDAGFWERAVAGWRPLLPPSEEWSRPLEPGEASPRRGDGRDRCDRHDGRRTKTDRSSFATTLA